MELIYITHGNVLNLHYLSAGLSWAVVIGGVYGVFRLGWDVLNLGLKAFEISRGEPPAP